jgi:hypothetical protein
LAIFGESAEGVAKILIEIFEMSFPAGVADFFFHAIEAAEFELGAATGFLVGHAGGDVCGDLLLDVEAQLFV